MEPRKSLILHFDSLEVLDELSKEQIAELFIAIRDYNLWKKIKLTWLMKAVFITFKNQFDRDLEKYKNICDRNSLNWAKWWRPKKTQETQSVITKPKKAYNDSKSKSKNDNKNNIINISKDIEQSSKIIKKDNRVLEIDLIIETLKELNWWIIDDKVQAQRRYWKHIKTKLDKMSWFNWDYVWFIKYIYQNSDEYRKQYFRSAEKFYYNIAWIVAWIKTQIKTKPKIVSV